jgi:hypothetical protein
MAIEAAFEAERMHREQQDDQHRIRDLELQQARYEARLAERRYAACDPDNRLIAAQLEKNWEQALRRVKALETRQLGEQPCAIAVAPDAFADLVGNLSAAWNAPGVTMRARQQLLRTLITDIVVDVDDEARDVVLTIHWRGGQHSELRVRKPRTGEHGCATAEDALAVMRSMAGRWSDEHIAASLNRMGLPTGQGKTWTAHRVSSVRRVRGIHAYRSAESRRVRHWEFRRQRRRHCLPSGDRLFPLEDVHTAKALCCLTVLVAFQLLCCIIDSTVLRRRLHELLHRTVLGRTSRPRADSYGAAHAVDRRGSGGHCSAVHCWKGDGGGKDHPHRLL